MISVPYNSIVKLILLVLLAILFWIVNVLPGATRNVAPSAQEISLYTKSPVIQKVLLGSNFNEFSSPFVAISRSHPPDSD